MNLHIERKGLMQESSMGLTDPLLGIVPAWRIEAEVTPIYSSMIVDYGSPWLGPDDQALGGVMVTVEAGRV